MSIAIVNKCTICGNPTPLNSAKFPIENSLYGFVMCRDCREFVTPESVDLTLEVDNLLEETFGALARAS